MTLVTRFAPSPTGFLHIGSARTALFNWLYTRHHGGKFYLRIEDTDRARSTQAAIDAIFSGMNWLGLNWDGEVVLQSAQEERHREVASEMVKAGHAYYCYATQAELEEFRAKHPHKKFQSPWRNNSSSSNASPVVRLKAPLEGTSVVQDAVYGTVSVQNAELDDMVLLRADGTPTYMLAVVVDDHDMGVNYVIRGDDHLTNTFRQNQIYDAMGWQQPRYAHIPLIHGPDGGKLSKRHGALGVDAYREMGYLPEAICNYLLRLGWSHGDLEIMSSAQAIELFDITAVNKSPARFDWDKLQHINAHYLRQKSDTELAALICNHMQVADELEQRILQATPLLKERAHTILELVESAAILRKRQSEPDIQSQQIMAAEHTQALLAELQTALSGIDKWDKDNLSAAFKVAAAACQCKPAQIMQTLRAALLGTFASPSILEIMLILGRQEVLERLHKVM